MRSVLALVVTLSASCLESRISFKNITPLREQFFIVWYTGDKALLSEQRVTLRHSYSVPVDPPSDARFFMIYSPDIPNNRLTADLIRLLDGKEYTIRLGPDRLLLWDLPQVRY